jgi:hypothetical protein
MGIWNTKTENNSDERESYVDSGEELEVFWNIDNTLMDNTPIDNIPMDNIPIDNTPGLLEMLEEIVKLEEIVGKKILSYRFLRITMSKLAFRDLVNFSLTCKKLHNFVESYLDEATTNLLLILNIHTLKEFGFFSRVKKCDYLHDLHKIETCGSFLRIDDFPKYRIFLKEVNLSPDCISRVTYLICTREAFYVLINENIQLPKLSRLVLYYNYKNSSTISQEELSSIMKIAPNLKYLSLYETKPIMFINFKNFGLTMLEIQASNYKSFMKDRYISIDLPSCLTCFIMNVPFMEVIINWKSITFETPRKL